MDRRVHGENSSSPNVNPLHVERLSSQGPGENVYTARLSNGTFFYVSADFLLEHPLRAGLDVPPELVRQLQREHEQTLIRQKALDLLNRSEHSFFC